MSPLSLTVLLLAACRTEPAPPDDAPLFDRLPEGHVAAEPTVHLVRASLALRGIRPSLAELEAVEADPAAFPGLVETWLAGPELGPTVRRMHEEWLLADIDNNYYPMGFPAVGPLSGVDAWAINESVSEAPARLAEHIVVEDRPYTELVTADYTLANRIVATVWGIPYDTDAGGWQVTQYDDGRPHAGVLSDPWLHVRHASTETNRQRARGAHMARALLCHDYMKRDVRVPGDVDLTAGGSNAIENNEVCVSCHSTLDPLGAVFAPFEGVIVPEAVNSYPIQEYRPSLAADYESPRFYGTPVADIAELGDAIADDSRFWRCTVRRFAGQVLARPAEQVPDAVVDRALPVFLDSGFQVKPLLAHLVATPEFREVGSEVGASDGVFRATPWLLANSIEDLTGVSWTTTLDYGVGFGRLGQVRLMEDTTFGFRTLAGGPDGYDAWDPIRTTDPTTLLVQRTLAARAAPEVVAADLALPAGERRLLGELGSDETGQRAAMVDLHFRMFGERLDPDGPEIDALYGVFVAAGGPDTAQTGWTAVVYALLRDPRILYY